MGRNMSPIIILSMPRSGSSMVSGIFANHGVWTGKCMPPSDLNQKGFYENLAIKRLLIKEMGRINSVQHRPIKDFKKRILSILKEEGYVSGPWLFKVSALYYKPFLDAFPDAKIVTVRRNLDSMKASQEKTGMKLKDEVIQEHLDIMDTLKSYPVRFDDIINGDFSGLEKAINGVGLEYDQSIVDSFVDPKLKRF